jgi:hypothetical protein
MARSHPLHVSGAPDPRTAAAAREFLSTLRTKEKSWLLWRASHDSGSVVVMIGTKQEALGVTSSSGLSTHKPCEEASGGCTQECA